MKRTKKSKAEKVEPIVDPDGFDEKEKDFETDPVDVQEPEIWFRKTGAGSFRTKNGTIIKPNQKFKAKPSDIPSGFRDLIHPLDDITEDAALPELTKSRFEVISKGAGWFDVVNISSGKAMNEKGLRVQAAKDLLESLE